MKVTVTGAGGFIGHQLVVRLKKEGHWVRGVDIKPPEFDEIHADEFLAVDLRELRNCEKAVQNVDDVYQLAADMGGIGYITANYANITRNNILINANMLEAAKNQKVGRYLYTSSACIYPHYAQKVEDAPPLKEEQAIPAEPEKGYGWEKLFAEQLTRYVHEDFGLDVRIVRFHNIYGPMGTWRGGKEKAPAAICRKVAEAQNGGSIEIWGDGKQTRSFCYVDDCVEGILRIMESGYTGPINLGRDDMVTVNELARVACRVAKKDLTLKHDPSKPQGVRGRNSDNSLLEKVTGWMPQISLEEGMSRTYAWIAEQVSKAKAKS